MTKFQSIKAVSKRLFVDGRYGLLAFVVIVDALIVSFCFPFEMTIRYTGGVLQLLGIFTVMWGIDETRAMFNHPSFSAKASLWLKNIFKRPKNVFLVSSVSSDTSVGDVELYQTNKPEPNASAEQRLESLEKNIELIHERISNTKNNIDTKFGKGAAALKGEIARIEAEIKSLSEKLENTEVGGLHISAMGALWLFVGVVLSTAAKEISVFLN